MKETKITNGHNYVQSSIDFECNDEPSLTLPGQSYTIREILDNFSRGIPLQLSKAGTFDEAPDFENMDITRQPDVDISDVHDELNETKKRIRHNAILEKEKNAIPENPEIAPTP